MLTARKLRIKSRCAAPWTVAELKQLGKVPDSVLARRTGRKIRMLGRYYDAELSRRLRRSYDDVRNQRIRLHIPSLRPLRSKRWTRAEEKLLGKFPDQELARRFGRSRESVQQHRIALGLRKYSLKSRP